MKRLTSTLLGCFCGVILAILLFCLPGMPLSTQIRTPLKGTTRTLIQQISTPLSSFPRASPQTSLIESKELEAFIDQFFSECMQAEHIPGAVFVLVKDGKIFFAKGYGYANQEEQLPVIPEKTVFRVGSVSKLFTATAVMQLVEQGKLNLNEDVNHYLKHFQLENNYSQPVTPANLLTNTSGIDENFIGIAARNPSEIKPLGDYLTKPLLRRSLPPGEILRYTNQGFALVGYLVEAISGFPFAQYVDEHILQPLGMYHSSFELQPPLLADLAVGYRYKNGSYQRLPIVYTNDMPSGALNVTATDMAHFAIAHLQNGRYGNIRILQDATARQMHQQQFTHHPQLPGQAYGFYERFQNGLRAIEHDGHIAGFKSRLFLLPDQNLGFFSAYNNDKGKLHNELIDRFLDHYYPQSNYSASGVLFSKEDGELSSFVTTSHPIMPDFLKRVRNFTGSYRYIRYPHNSIEKLAALLPSSPLSTSELQITANGDGTLTLGKSRLIEIEPMLFGQSGGSPLQFSGITFPDVAFREDEHGYITHLFMGKYAFEKLSWYETTRFQLSLLGVCILVFLSGVMAGFLRNLKRYGYNLLSRCFPTQLGQYQGLSRGARSLAELVCLLNLVFIISFVLVLALMDLSEFAYGMPILIKALLCIPVVTTSLTLGLPVFAVLAWRHEYWSVISRLHYSLIMLAALGFLGFLDYWNILGFRF